MTTREIPVGTLVAIKDVHRLNKNEPPMLAPYTIHEKCQNGGYRVRDKAGGILPRTVPIDHIRPLYHAKRQDDIGRGADYYTDFIVSHRKRDSRDEYLVKWVGTDETTWTSVNDIADYNLIHEYLKSLTRIPKTKTVGRDRLRASYRADTDPSLLDEDLDEGSESMNILPLAPNMISSGGSHETKRPKTKSSTVTKGKGSSTKSYSTTDPVSDDPRIYSGTKTVSSPPTSVSGLSTTSRKSKPVTESLVASRGNSVELPRPKQVVLTQPNITTPANLNSRSTTAKMTAVSSELPRQVVETCMKPKVSRTGRLLKPKPQN